jgi:hypothetical protein
MRNHHRASWIDRRCADAMEDVKGRRKFCAITVQMPLMRWRLTNRFGTGD